MEEPRILLVGNYPPDAQNSMLRYVEMLRDGLRARGREVETIFPEPCLNRFRGHQQGAAKWAGYIDKFLLFPLRLRRRIEALADRPLVVHVCDHSNAPYLWWLNGNHHLITCHDLLAVRAALGEYPQHPVRWTGRLFQKMILTGLSRARHCVCVSAQTRLDLRRLTALPEWGVEVIPHALNYPFRPMPPEEARLLLARHPAFSSAGGGPFRFLLHVGTEVWYKNRSGLLRIYAGLCRLRSDAPPLVLVGPPLPTRDQEYLIRSGLENRVRAAGFLDGEALRAAYSSATALLFPSLAEGFGWPVLEAMACGCPVATSSRPPMTEVGGDAAAYFAPERPAEAAMTVALLLDEDPATRSRRVERGLRRAAAFSQEVMLDRYEAAYRAAAE